MATETTVSHSSGKSRRFSKVRTDWEGEREREGGRGRGDGGREGERREGGRERGSE